MTDTTERLNTGTFEEMMRDIQPELLRAARRKTRNDQDAEDLFQNTLMRGFQAFDQYEQGTNFRAWMFTILANTWINMLRYSERRPKTVGITAAIEATYMQDECDPQDFIDGLADDNMIDAVRSLPEAQRDLFIYVAVNGRSYNEAAAHFGIPVGTVMSRLSRARTKLAAALAVRDTP